MLDSKNSVIDVFRSFSHEIKFLLRGSANDVCFAIVVGGVQKVRL